MDSKNIKQLILDSLKAAEAAVEADLQQDEQSKKTSGYLISLFKLLGLDLVDRLVQEAKRYIEKQIQKGVEKFAQGLSGVVAYVMMLLVGMLTIFIGMVFGAVALSLWIGKLIGSLPLGFVLSGILLMGLTLLTARRIFNRERMEKGIIARLDFGFGSQKK